MKESLKFVYHACFEIVFMTILKRAVHSLQSSAKVYMVDVDNTLADTWPSLKDKVYFKDNVRYQTLSVFIGMRNYLLQVLQQHKVIFISARQYSTYLTTRQWLADCGFKGATLILVPSPAAKISFLKALVKRNKEVVYIDDLTYNHEHGEVKHFTSLIPIIAQLPITYWGVYDIELINSADETEHKNTQTHNQNLPDPPVD